MSAKVQISDKLLRIVQAQIKRQTGKELEANRIKAYILLDHMKNAINKHPSTQTFKMFRQLVWRLVSGRQMEDYFSYLMWSDLMTSIKNAQKVIILHLEEPTWEHLVEQIKMYSTTDQLPLVEEYLPEVEKLLKSG